MSSMLRRSRLKALLLASVALVGAFDSPPQLLARRPPLRLCATAPSTNLEPSSSVLSVKYIYDSNLLNLRDSMETSLGDLERSLLESGNIVIQTSAEDVAGSGTDAREEVPHIAERLKPKSLGKFEIYQGQLMIDEILADLSKEELEKELLIRCKAAVAINRAFKELKAKKFDRESFLSSIEIPQDGMQRSAKFAFERMVGVYAARRAALLCRGLQGRLVGAAAAGQGKIDKAEDSSPVTIADFLAQTVVLSILSLFFPEDGFIAEETSVELQRDTKAFSTVLALAKLAVCSDWEERDICAALDLGGKGHYQRTWVLDPIDGTKGFLRGEQFCVALGFLSKGIPRIGILGCPNIHTKSLPDKGEKGTLFIAEEGCGAYVVPLSGVATMRERVAMRDPLPEQSIFCEGVEAKHYMFEVTEKVAEDLGIMTPPVRMDSQCKYGVLARGEADLYLRLPHWGYVEKIWDHAAGYIVVREAGGLITDATGADLVFDRKGGRFSNDVAGVVGAPANIHGVVLAAVRKHMIHSWAKKVAAARRDAPWGALPALPGVVWPGAAWRLPRAQEWWSRENRRAAAGGAGPGMVRTESQYATLKERGWDKLSVVVYHGRWSGEMMEVMTQLRRLCSEELCDTRLRFYEVDVTKVMRVANNADIRTLPTLRMYHGGRRIDQYDFGQNFVTEHVVAELHNRIQMARGIIAAEQVKLKNAKN